jgi:hypothetical protein
LNEKSNQIREKMHAYKGKQSSLETLQKASLNKDDASLKQWLKEWNLVDTPKLGEKLVVCFAENYRWSRIRFHCSSLDAQNAFRGEFSS